MQPQPKRCRRPPNHAFANPLPGCENPSDNSCQYTGHFTGLSVEVSQADHIRQLYENGGFGIGSQTQAAPAVLWQPQDEASAANTETLVLFLEEAFFLNHSLGCLGIRDLNDVQLKSKEIYTQFCGVKPNFPRTFIAYLHLRTANWVVKAGLKFGGDFLLYKEGPRYFHASYVVLVRTAGSDDSTAVTDLNTHHMQGMFRIAEASKKELLIVEIAYPDGLTSASPPATLFSRLNEFAAAEFVPRRFNFNHERGVGEQSHSSLS